MCVHFTCLPLAWAGLSKMTTPPTRSELVSETWWELAGPAPHCIGPAAWGWPGHTGWCQTSSAPVQHTNLTEESFYRTSGLNSLLPSHHCEPDRTDHRLMFSDLLLWPSSFWKHPRYRSCPSLWLQPGTVGSCQNRNRQSCPNCRGCWETGRGLLRVSPTAGRSAYALPLQTDSWENDAHVQTWKIDGEVLLWQFPFPGWS